jgi:hypothetical protein
LCDQHVVGDANARDSISVQGSHASPKRSRPRFPLGLLAEAGEANQQSCSTLLRVCVRRHIGRRIHSRLDVPLLLGLENNPNCTRFFVTRNSSMETKLRQPPDWLDFAFIDIEAVEKCEDNWDLLKTYETPDNH